MAHVAEIWLGFFFLLGHNFHRLGKSGALTGYKMPKLELFHHQHITPCQGPRGNQTCVPNLKDGSLAKPGQEGSGDILQQTIES